MSRVSRSFRRTFLTGLFIVAPFSLTFILIAWFVQLIDAAVSPIADVFGRPIPGFGLIVGLALIYVAGMIGSNIAGQHVLEIVEEMLMKIPIFNWLYRTIKQISEVFAPTSKQAFKGVVLVEYPRPEIWSMGFVTNEVVLEEGSHKKKLVSVYIPTNHMYIGDFVLVPADKVVATKLSQQEGVQAAISAGAALPQIVRRKDEK